MVNIKIIQTNTKTDINCYHSNKKVGFRGIATSKALGPDDMALIILQLIGPKGTAYLIKMLKRQNYIELRNEKFNQRWVKQGMRQWRVLQTSTSTRFPAATRGGVLTRKLWPFCIEYSLGPQDYFSTVREWMFPSSFNCLTKKLFRFIWNDYHFKTDFSIPPASYLWFSFVLSELSWRLWAAEHLICYKFA